MASEKKVKITLIGPQKSGKTSLLNRFINDIFSSVYQPTIGIDFLGKTFGIISLVSKKEVQIRTQIWDTAGQERFKSLIPSYIRDAAAVGIVLTPDPKDLAQAKYYYDQAKLHAGEDVPIYFIINKMDAAGDSNKQTATWGKELPTFDQEQLKNKIKEFIPEADENNILFCSAETGMDVAKAFKTMGAGGRNYNLEGQPEPEEEKPLIRESSFSPPPSSNPPWLLDIIVNFIADHATWARGNAFLIVAAIVTLVTLASLPIGGVPILFGLSVLAVAGIATGAAFLLWNLGCLIGNFIGGGDGPPTLPTHDDSLTKGWTNLNSSPPTQQQTQQYRPVYKPGEKPQQNVDPNAQTAQKEDDENKYEL